MYQTTRSSHPTYSFEQVVTLGVVPGHNNAGLFVPIPNSIPPCTSLEIQQLSTFTSFAEVAYAIARKFIPLHEVPDDVLHNIVQQSYVASPPPISRSLERVSLSREIFVLDLCKGPSCSFKDVSMKPALLLLEYFLAKRKVKAAVIVATSGDTGPSLLECSRGLNQITSIVLFPRHRVSWFQRRQMETFSSRNACICSIGDHDADSDSLDVLAAKLFTALSVTPLVDEQHHHVLQCSMNSFNFARIVFNIPHFFWALFRARDAGIVAQNVGVVIPTGAMGNAFAGLLAVHVLGLPLQLFVAQNDNDVVCEFIKSGILSMRTASITTLSNAMDIRLPYNLERCIFLLTQGNGKEKADFTSNFMLQFETHGVAQFEPRQVLTKAFLTSSGISDVQVLDRIRVWRGANHGRFLDPHTAVGLVAIEREVELNDAARLTAWVVLSTALPVKLQFEVAEMLTYLGVVGDTVPALPAAVVNVSSSVMTLEVNNMEKDSDECVTRILKGIQQLFVRTKL